MKRFCIFAVIAVLALQCSPRRPVGNEEIPGAAGEPVTLGVLKLMPESAVAAIAIPSVNRTYEQIETLLLRGAPADINMEAELKVIVSQMARLAGALEASTIEEIALDKGIESQKPIGIFLGSTSAETPSAQVQNEMLRQVGFSTVPPFAAVLPVASRQDAEKFVTEWGGSGTMDAVDLDTPATTIFTNTEKTFSYFFTDSQLVAGSDPALVLGVAERMKGAGASIRYGTAECPADGAYEIVQLIRTDKLPKDSNATMPGAVRNALPSGAADAAAEAWSGWLGGYTGTDPMVITWKLDEDRATVRARLDYTKHPEAQERLSEAKSLRHVTLVPKGTLGLYSLEITPRMREGMKELTAEMVGGGGGLVDQINEAFGQLIDTAGGEATFAVLGPGNDFSNLAMFVEFTDGNATRSLMKELGMAPLVAETYNNTEIYSLILPAPAPIYYALPKNTLVVATSTDKVKTMIDAVESGKASSFAEALNPPLDPSVPRRQVLVVTRAAVTEALLPALRANGAIAGETASAAERGLEKIRDARLTTEVVNNWQDTKLVIQLE